MVPRSWLFVPGDSPRKIERACAGQADALIIDWEDAVAPSDKGAGRAQTRAALDALQPSAQRCWIRLNAVDSPWFVDDVAALPVAAIAGVVLPKCCGPADLARLGKALSRQEAAAGAKVECLQVLAIVTETAASVLALSEFREPVPRLAAMLWGGEDLSADLGIPRNRDTHGQYRTPFLLARNLMLFACAATECWAIDAVDVDFRNLDRLAMECADARADGFVAKAAIHPAQVDVINRAFSATSEELAWAQRVVQALADGGVAVVDGKMVDAPHLKVARRILGSVPAA